ALCGVAAAGRGSGPAGRKTRRTQSGLTLRAWRCRGSRPGRREPLWADARRGRPARARGGGWGPGRRRARGRWTPPGGRGRGPADGRLLVADPGDAELPEVDGAAARYDPRAAGPVAGRAGRGATCLTVVGVSATAGAVAADTVRAEAAAADRVLVAALS